MRILFIGSKYLGSNARSLLEAFQDLEHDVFSIDPAQFFPFRYDIRNRIAQKFSIDEFHLSTSQNMFHFIERQIDLNSFDLLFVFRGVNISPDLLSAFRGFKAHFHPDDSSNAANRSFLFEVTESLYDVHFTPKRLNVSEIKERTKNNNVHFIWYAYDPRIHKRTVTDYGNGVGFIGNRRPDRIEIIKSLSERYGKEFFLAGQKWKRNLDIVLNAQVSGFVTGHEYQELLRKAPIQLGLLNSDNRDTHTARSFEIPAAGGLFLGEDTDEHRTLFTSWENAVLFENETDLFEKIDFLRKEEQLLHRIRKQGEKRMISGENTWKDRASKMILQIVK
jgi:spore maturation protein CgeB